MSDLRPRLDLFAVTLSEIPANNLCLFESDFLFRNLPFDSNKVPKIYVKVDFNPNLGLKEAQIIVQDLIYCLRIITRYILSKSVFEFVCTSSHVHVTFYYCKIILISS